MGFIKPIEQYLFGNLLTKIHVFMYLKDIIRGRNAMIAKIAETVSAFFYSMSVIDEEEK